MVPYTNEYCVVCIQYPAAVSSGDNGEKSVSLENVLPVEAAARELSPWRTSWWLHILEGFLPRAAAQASARVWQAGAAFPGARGGPSRPWEAALQVVCCRSDSVILRAKETGSHLLLLSHLIYRRVQNASAQVKAGSTERSQYS